ncbi:MAG: TolC family protein [Elusimicrobiota bacterium]|jgi:outer membrane protein TolC
MSGLRWRLLALALALSPAASRAEVGRSLLTWEDCVAIAGDNNPDLGASRRAQEAGQAAYKGSFNGLLPQLNLSNSLSESGGRGNTWQAQASASVDVFNVANIASIKSSKAALIQAQASLRQSAASVRFSLRQAFLQLLYAQESVELSRQIQELQAKNARLVTLRYNGGTESKGNMLQAQAEAAQAEIDLQQDQLNLRTAQKALDRQLGWDDFRPLAATGTLTSQTPPESLKVDESLLSLRPDISLQEAVVKSFMASVEQSRSSLWPNLSASYSRSRTGGSEFPSAQYGWSFGGVLSYPLFGGGPTAAYHAVAAAQRRLEKAKEDLRSVRNQAIVSLENAWSGFVIAARQVRIKVLLLEASRQRNAEADIRYSSGLMSYDNWQIISAARISQERQILNARLAAVSAEASWDQALGKGLGE